MAIMMARTKGLEILEPTSFRPPRHLCSVSFFFFFFRFRFRPLTLLLT